jgi:putative ABC transport system permease protein
MTGDEILMGTTDPTGHAASRGRTVAAVLILTLAFAFLSAALNVGKAVLWDELPYKEPSRIVVLNGTYEEEGTVQPWAIGHLDFLDLRRESRVFDAVSVFTLTGGVAYNLRTAAGLERNDGELVSHTYFQALGIAPALGRFFTAGEDGQPFVHPVTVISHDLWRDRFQGDPGIVGRTIVLNGQNWQVIGVGPEGFRGLTDTARFWIPSSMAPGPEYVEVRRMRWLNGVARLKPGITLAQAQADMDRVMADLARQYPDQNRGIGVSLQPVRELVYAPGLQRSLRLVVLGAAALLLLACIDAAGLLGTGVSRARAAGIAVTGAVLGIALGAAATRALLPTSGFTFPGFARLTPGPAVVAAVLVLAVLCGLALTRLGRRPLVTAAAAVQVILALALLVSAGARYREYRAVVGRDLGFRPENLLTLRLDLEGPRYANDADVARLAGEYLRRLESLPEVESAAITGPTMATDDWAGAFVTAEDHDNPKSDDGTYRVLTHGVSPGFFKILDVPVVQGRPFNWQDTQGYHVILSRAMAGQVWPGQNPLGRRLKFSARKVQPRPWLTVVGVVEDARYQGYFKDERPSPDFYLSVLQQPVRLPMILNVLLRPRPGVSMESLESAARKAILAITPDSPPYDVATLEGRLEKQTWKARSEVLIVSLFAGAMVALALAALPGAVLSGRRPSRFTLASGT